MSQVITGSAVLGFRGLMVKSSISLYLKTGMKPTRGVGPTQMVAIASEFTGKAYKRGRKGLEQALADLEALFAARPSLHEVGETRQVNKEVGGVAADL